jgi:hypothetical protein
MSASLATAVAVMAACQIYKVVVCSIRDRRLQLSRLLSTGGMPSTHTALVTALTVSLALWYGLASEYLAISGVFAAIIAYDSIRVRGMVDLHTRILRDLQAKVAGSAGIVIPRWVGHTPAETGVGVLVGAAVAVALHLLTRGGLRVGPSGG